jgi:hypothetical protein
MQVLIFDDLVEIAKLIKEKVLISLPGAECFITNNWTDFEKCIQQSRKRKIIFVNVCIKRDETEKRWFFSGIEGVIKHGLRIKLMRKEPIIGYGVLSKEEMLRSSEGSIFKNDYHLYFDLKDLININFHQLLGDVKRIADDKELGRILLEFCKKELYNYLSSCEHRLKKYKVDNKEGRVELVEILNGLKKLFTLMEGSGFSQIKKEILSLIKQTKKLITDAKYEEAKKEMCVLKQKLKDFAEVICKNLEEEANGGQKSFVLGR